MKFQISYYLVLLYITVMFKPLIPFISDIFSHTFSEAVHISTVHALYGNNHLEKELSNTASDTTNNKHQNNINTEDPVLVHVSTYECIYRSCFTRADKDYSSLKPYKLRPGFILKNFPPPKFS